CPSRSRDARLCARRARSRPRRGCGRRSSSPPSMRMNRLPLPSGPEPQPALRRSRRYSGSGFRAPPSARPPLRFVRTQSLREEEYTDRDPALVLRTPKKREVLPDVLDRRELSRLLRATERDDIWERHYPARRTRDRLMLALFAFGGLPKSELLGLDWDDIDLK